MALEYVKKAYVCALLDLQGLTVKLGHVQRTAIIMESVKMESVDVIKDGVVESVILSLFFTGSVKIINAFAI